MMAEPKRILFVCTGNSCRSVMAQGLLQHRLKQLEHKLTAPIHVESAGVFAIQGMPPSAETATLLQAIGVDVSGHMAQPLTDELVKLSDMIFAMEWFHLEEILRRSPHARQKVKLLKPFALPEGEAVGDPNIPDPIGKSREAYEACFAVIRQAVERLAQHLITERVT